MQKKHLFNLIAFLFACSVANGQTRELLKNGGFEDGIRGWEITGELARGANIAHTGTNCIFGEVTQPKNAQHVRVTLPLRKDRLYRLSFWARGRRSKLARKGVRGPKIVVWLRHAERKKDRMVASYRMVWPKWHRFVTTFAPIEDGDWVLDIVSPSSFGAAIGSTWVDDVSLIEVTLPPSMVVSGEGGIAEWPDLALDGPGSAYCAWIAFDDGCDRVRIARVGNLDSDKPAVQGTWELDLGGKVYVSRLALASAQDGVWLAASCEVKGEWDIYLAKLGRRGPEKPIRVTRNQGTNVYPALAAAAGRLMLAWETNRDGSRQVYACDVTGGEVREQRRVSQGGFSNGRPDLAGGPDGRARLVWESFREGNYDIYGAQFDGEKWSLEERLTTDPRIEHRPRVAVGPNGVWLAWELMRCDQKYHTSAAVLQTVMLARWTPAGLMLPEGMEKVFPNYSQHPTLTVDDTGRVWVAARRSAGQNAGWNGIVKCFTGKGWTDERELAAQQGRAQHVPMVVAGGRVILAVQADTVPGRYPDVEKSKDVTSAVRLCSLTTRGTPPAGPPALVKYAPQGESTLAEHRREFGEDLPPRSITYNGKKLHLFWGQFHEHSEISVCNRRGDLAPEDNYTHNRDIHKMDFSALTDHGYNISPHVWNYLAKLVRTENDPGRFVTFLAEEWTSTHEKYSKEHPFGYYGHRNLVFADPYFPRWFNALNEDTPKDIWDELRKVKANFIHIPHQLADNGNVPTDWNFTDEVAQPVAEIFQNRQSYEYRDCPRQAKNVVPGAGYFIQEAWAKGVVIGVIASPDHGGGGGKAAVYAPELTREAILDACRARHTYGTTAAKIFLDVRVNGRLMGEKFAVEKGPVTVKVDAVGAGDIERVDICRNNEFVYTVNPDSRESHFQFEDTRPLERRTYYYVRVIQKDQEIAWSSPVWLELR